MKISSMEATFEDSKGSIAFDISEAEASDVTHLLTVINSLVNHPSTTHEQYEEVK